MISNLLDHRIFPRSTNRSTPGSVPDRRLGDEWMSKTQPLVIDLQSDQRSWKWATKDNPLRQET